MKISNIKIFNIKILKVTVFIFLASFLLALGSCGSTEKSLPEEGDFIYKPEISSGFEIREIKNSNAEVISVFNPWQDADNVVNKLLISPEGGDFKNSDIQVLKGTPNRIICMSSTHIAMLDELGAIDKVAGVSGMPYISNKYILENKDRIPDIGYEGNIDYEQLVAVNPDLVLLFSVNGASGMEPKLKELGIPFLYVGDYVEEEPLGKVEWIVALAEVLGKREKGIEVFKKVSGNYNALKKKVEEASEPTPTVMVNAPFGDSWFMPSSESYVAKMIRDAGGKYIYEKNTGSSSLPIEQETALKLVSETDFWINIGSVKSKDELINDFPKFAQASCIKEGRIFNNNLKATPGGGNDCYEKGAVRQDLILSDLIKIFHPQLIEEDFNFYHRLE